ncbi:unnamed protein product [Closterium sp. Yama58-4]|nr:unnamed protein product [Closterium sp. Yama58-4]
MTVGEDEEEGEDEEGEEEEGVDEEEEAGGGDGHGAAATGRHERLKDRPRFVSCQTPSFTFLAVPSAHTTSPLSSTPLLLPLKFSPTPHPPNLSHSPLSHSPLSHSPLSHSPLSHSPLSHSPLSHSPLSHSPLSHSPLSHSPLSYSLASLPSLPLPSLPLAPLSRSPLSYSLASHSPPAHSPSAWITCSRHRSSSCCEVQWLFLLWFCRERQGVQVVPPHSPPTPSPLSPFSHPPPRPLSPAHGSHAHSTGALLAGRCSGVTSVVHEAARRSHSAQHVRIAPHSPPPPSPTLPSPFAQRMDHMLTPQELLSLGASADTNAAATAAAAAAAAVAAAVTGAGRKGKGKGKGSGSGGGSSSGLGGAGGGKPLKFSYEWPAIGVPGGKWVADHALPWSAAAADKDKNEDKETVKDKNKDKHKEAEEEEVDAWEGFKGRLKEHWGRVVEEDYEQLLGLRQGGGGSSSSSCNGNSDGGGKRKRGKKSLAAVENGSAGGASSGEAVAAVGASDGFASDHQRQFFSLCTSYTDVLHSRRPCAQSKFGTPLDAQALTDAYLLHAEGKQAAEQAAEEGKGEEMEEEGTESVLFKKGGNGGKRGRKGPGGVVMDGKELVEVENIPRDQGFTRPKVLLLLPYRNSALNVVQRLLRVTPPQSKVSGVV